jgi:hypothetical protein
MPAKLAAVSPLQQGMLAMELVASYHSVQGQALLLKVAM